MAERLPNAPLVEAILELHWGMTRHPDSGFLVDPHFKFLLGRFQQAVSDDYGYVEELPTAALPEEIADRQVQFRFRAAPDAWPLLQLGPGILTLNHTQYAEWADFERRALQTIAKLQEAHPAWERLKVERVSLSFVNSDPFDFRTNDVLDHLRSNMKIDVTFHADFFEQSLSDTPSGFRLKLAFPCSQPAGRFEFGTGFGRRGSEDVLLWELKVESTATHNPTNDLSEWLQQAHATIEAWFFKMAEGPLLRTYAKEPSHV